MRRSTIKLFGQQFDLLSRVFNIQSNVNHLVPSSSFVDNKYYNRNTILSTTARRNICREFSTFNQLQQQVKPIDQPIIKKWTLDSLVSDVVTEEYTDRNKQEFLQEDLELLKANRIKTLEDWKTLPEQRKKKYPDGLAEILDKACNIEEIAKLTHEEKKKILTELINVASIEHLHEKPRVRNQLFQSFVHREEGKRRVIEAAKLNIESFEKNKIEIREEKDTMVRKFHNFIQIIGGSGSGKTRAACEVGNTLREAAKTKELPPVFHRTCEVYIDFFNGNTIGIYDEEREVSSVLGLRIFVRALRNESTVSNFADTIGLQHFKTLSRQGAFEFDAVIEVLSQFCHQSFHIEQSEPIPLVIILDEFQFTMKDFNGKLLLHLLGNYFCNLTGLNQKLVRDQFILMPVVAGTLPSGASEQMFQATGYGCIKYPLPSFPLPIVQKLAQEEGILPELFVGHELQRFWYLMGLVPRSLERAIIVVKQLLIEYQGELIGERMKQFTEQLYYRVTEQLEALYDVLKLRKIWSNGVEPIEFDERNPYTSSKAEDDLLLMYCLTGVEATKDQLWLQRLEEQGKIYMTGDRRLFLPYPVFKRLLAIRSWIPSDCLPILRSSFSWEDLEQLDIRIISHRISLFNRSGCQFVRMGDLFPGHGDVSLLEKVNVQVNEVSFATEREYYIKVKVKKDEVTKKKEKIILVDDHDKEIYIDSREKGLHKEERMRYMLCAKVNHPFTDARWFTKTKEGKPVLVLVQYKYTRTDSEPSSTPIEWYQSFANKISQAYPGYQIIYVYITNANIEKDAKEAIDKYPDEMIVVEGSIASKYFAPTILPYFTFTDLTDDTFSMKDKE